MAVKQYQRVLALFVANKGEIVTRKDLETTFKGTPVVLSRLSTYLWEMRGKAGAKIEVVREGKSVTGYRLTNDPKAEDVIAKEVAITKLSDMEKAKVKVEKEKAAAKAKAEKEKAAKLAAKAKEKVAKAKTASKAKTPKSPKAPKVQTVKDETQPEAGVPSSQTPAFLQDQPSA